MPGRFIHSVRRGPAGFPQLFLLDPDRNIIESFPEKLLKEPLTEKDVHLPRNKGHFDDWMECLKTRETPIAGVEVGARSVTVCHLVNLAYYHGQKMKWNPKSEKFAGGTGNKAWLDVPQRDPWKVA